MSIDALIQAHIEALNTNTKAVELLTLSLAGRTPAKADKDLGKTGEKVIDKFVEDLKKDEPKAKKEEVIKVADDEIRPAKTKGDPVPYETVRALVLKLARGGKREGIQALWAKYSIANLKVLLDDEKDLNSVNDQAKLEAVYADLQALEA